MDGSNDSVSESPINWPMMIAVLCIVFAMWFVGCLVSTRCCRRWGENDELRRTSGVWGIDSRFAMTSENAQALQDFRLAQQLQNQEMNATPEEREAARAEREQKAQARRELIKKVLPDGKAFSKSDCPDDENQQCAICLADYEQGDIQVSGTARLCQHVFHRQCIAEWLVLQSACPVCRQIFLLEDIKEERGDDEPVIDV